MSVKNVNQPRLDVAETVYFGRALEEIKAGAQEVKYEQLKGLTLVPVNTSISPAKMTYTYKQYDGVGNAKMVKAYGKDFPRVEIFGKEFTFRFHSIGASFAYNFQEIRAAKSEGFPLEQRRANMARKAIDQQHEKILRDGDAALGLSGFLNIPGALDATGTMTAAGSGWGAGDTADAILGDLYAVSTYMVEQTKEVEKPNTMILPLSTYNYISQRRMGAGDGAMTVLQLFLQNSQYISQIVSWTALETAGAGGTKRGVVYRRDPEVLEYLAPVLFEQFPAQEEMMEFVVPVHGRTGGVVCYLPKAVAYFDGF